MFKLKFKKLSNLLKNNKLVPVSVKNNLTELAKIEKILQQFLPEELKNHCFPLNIRKMELTLMVDSPAVHTKLRFTLPSLEQALQDHYHRKINLINIKICPKPLTIENPPQQSQRIALSSETRSHIQSMADEMEPSDLKDALSRLSKNKHSNS